MEEDTPPFARAPKMASLPNPTRPANNFVPNNYGKCYIGVCMATPIFHVKQASSSQDTVDLFIIIVQKEQEK